MGKWRWEGFDAKGKKISGSLEAESAKELRRNLRSQGIRPLRVHAPSVLELDLNQWMVDKGFAKPFGNKELTTFTNQLSTMINAGVPILQALEILHKQEKHPVMKITVKKIAAEVGSGKTLSDAMSAQNGFDKLYCNLVKAGETGGILDEILDKLAEYMEKQEKTKAQIKGALTYPAIVVFVGTGVVWGLMVFVVPQFTDMLTESGQEVPWVTQTVVDISDFLQAHGLKIIGVLILLFLFLKKAISTPEGKPVYDRFTMNLPVFGGIIIKGNLASFARTLSTMMSSGVSLIDSLDVCRETIDNTIIKKDVLMVRKSVVEGKTLTEPLMRIKYFPEMVAQMIKVGESTGNVDAMLLKVAQIFEREVEDLITNATKLIEPLILVVLGGIVGFILIAMYMPIFMSAGGA